MFLRGVSQVSYIKMVFDGPLRRSIPWSTILSALPSPNTPLLNMFDERGFFRLERPIPSRQNRTKTPPRSGAVSTKRFSSGYRAGAVMQTTLSLRYSTGVICLDAAGCQSSEHLEICEAEDSFELWFCLYCFENMKIQPILIFSPFINL